MTTLSNDRSAPSADELRARLTDQLIRDGVIRTPRVENAFRQIPREPFLPGFTPQEAYADTPVYTKTDESGNSISAASQPRVVAMMLEQLNLQPGDRVMEAGAGTGVNAAYMGHIVGPGGHVVTIDVDDDLVNGARAHLNAAGVTNVEVICGDGAVGHAAGAPYDKVIATVGAYEIPTAWLEQLARRGRLLVPLRLRGAAARCITFERAEYGWRSVGSELAAFMPLRGSCDDAVRTIALTPAADVTLAARKDQAVDEDALARVLFTKRHYAWTGVTFAAMESFEWLDLWLACRLDNAILRMSATQSAFDRDRVARMFAWGAMATVQGTDLAYLTIRSAPVGPDGGKHYEVGVVGHGLTSTDLCKHVAEEIQRWDADFRHRAVRFELPDTPPAADPPAGRFLLDRPHHPITVIWE